MAKKLDLLKHVTPEYQVRRGAVKCESGLGLTHIAKAIYDTAGTDSAGVSNKTIAAHGLGVYLPIGAIVVNAYIDIVTTFTDGVSDSATIAASVQSAGDIKAAIAISDASNVWDAGLHGGLPGSYAEATVAGDTAILDAARKAASYIKITAERELTMTVAGVVLTAGKGLLVVEYIVGL